MFELPRLKPEPLPDIHPLPEYLASGELKHRYDEMKRVFQVPWMGVVTMAYAYYPTFYGHLWEGVKTLCASKSFVDASQDLRNFPEQQVVSLTPNPLAEALSNMGYAARELGNIRDSVEIFSHGNFPYLLLATLTRGLLEGQEPLSPKTKADAYAGRHAPEVSVPFLLMESHHADEPTQAVYHDVMATLGLPFVNTDYRAFARWPSYFALAWQQLRPHISTQAYNARVLSVHEHSIELVNNLPNPSGICAASLQAAAQTDARLDEVLQMSRLFQWLLPGLVTNVAFFRHQLIN